MAETMRIEIPIETVDNTDPELTQITKKLNNMEKAADSAASSTKKATETVSKFDKSAEKTQKSLAAWAKEKYQILLEAKDKITPVLSTIKGGLRGFAGKAWSVTVKAVDLVTAPVRGILNLLKNPIFQAGAVLGVTFSVADTVNTYKDFEAAMSQVKAVSGATGSEFDKLTAKAKEMGATTKFTAKESAEAFNYMAMAGWNAEQMTDGISGILNLAAASDEDLATTSDIVTDALTAFGLKASDATHFSDVLAQASSSANTDVGMMGETFKYVASMAGSLSYSIEDVALMTGLMANSGIKSTQAGTALNSVLTRLATNSSGAADAIAELGVNFYDSSGNARPLATVMGELREATAGMNQEQKSNLANTVAGMEAQKGLLAILNASQEDYDKLAESINHADGAAEKMSKIKLDNLKGDITYFQSAVDGLKISLGKRLSNSWLRDIVQWLTAQVPNVKQALNDAMDSVEIKLDSLKHKFKEVTDTDEWKNADFFGKAKIAWDDFIVEPFSEWWSSKGKTKINAVAGDIGNAIGTGLTVGIGTILGINLSETIDEGSTLGASFAKGFSEGFDFSLISEKIWDGLGNLFSNAAKLLPGGQSADLSSVLSAGILMKISKPFVGLGKGAASLGKSLFGKGTVGTSLAGTLMGSAATGSGILGKAAMLAVDLGAGNIAGGASMSAGALSALGLGAGAGAVAGGTTLISAGIDTYKAIKANDNAQKSAYGASAGLKFGGVGAGAAAGAAIGSVIPGLGTAVGALVGAGVGGVAGWLGGNKVKKDYQKSAEEMQAMSDKVQAVYNATGITIDKTSKFANKSLKDALNDSSVSAEDFAAKFQESCADVMKDSFGDIKLSFTEIKKLAEEITFGDMKEGLDEFNTATESTQSSLTALKSSVSTMKRENWKINLGMQLSDTDIDDYKQSVDTFVKNAQTYINDNHYEATVALNLLTDGKGDTTGLDTMYNSFTQQVDDLSAELSEKMNIALEDGVITLDESAELTNLQQQITDITNKLADAESQSELDAISIKFKASGAELTPESYSELQEQLNDYMNNAVASYDNAMKISLKNVDLQLSEEVISEEEAAEMKKQIEEGYTQKLSDLNLKVQAFNLQTIADTFGSQLDGILPDIEGTTAEKLQKAVNNALAQKSDVSSWDDTFMKSIFDLDGLDAELQQLMETLLKSTAESTPAMVKEQLLQSYKDSIPTSEEIMEADVDFIGPYTEEIQNQLSALDLSNADMEALKTSLSDGVATAIEGADMDKVNAALDIVKGNVDTSASAKFGAGYNVTMPLTVTFDYSVSNPTMPSSLMPSTSYSITPQKHAAGGYVSGGPQLSWLAEEGYGEFVIPTNPSRRSRALELYEQAGQVLGVTAHAEGGYVSGSNTGLNTVDYNLFNETIKTVPHGYYETTEDNTENNPAVFEPVSTTAPQQGGNSPVSVNVSVSPEFVINGTEGQSESDIMAIIKKNMKSMADELGGEIAERLERVFENMPTVREA
jgi:TP901 family phage tail tape measure protein